jgi:hypothetical protein
MQHTGSAERSDKWSFTIKGDVVKSGDDPYSLYSCGHDVWQEKVEGKSALEGVTRFAWRFVGADKVKGLLTFLDGKPRKMSSVIDSIILPRHSAPFGVEYSTIYCKVESISKKDFNEQWMNEQFNNHRKIGTIHDVFEIKENKGRESQQCNECGKYNPEVVTKQCAEVSCK